MRTIEFMYEPGELSQFIISLDERIKEGTNISTEVWSALGYLINWGYGPDGNTVKVMLGLSEDGPCAAYFDKDGHRRFFIQAVWRVDEQRFSFHS